MGRIPPNLLDGDEHPLGNGEVPQAGCDPDHVHHAPADHGELPAVAVGRVHDLLDAMNVRGEGGHQDPALGPAEDVHERLAHHPLREGVPGPLGVGAVGHEQEHALPAQLRELLEVRHLAVDGRLVELEVGHIEDDARRGMNGERHVVGDGVVDVDELHLEPPDGPRFAGPHLPEAGLAQELVLFELGLHQAQGQPRAVDRDVQLAEHVGQRADMVLVAMGEDDAANPVFPLHEVGDVGYDQVDPRHLILGEHDTRVDDQDLALALDDRHVLADLAQPAQRDDRNFWYLGQRSPSLGDRASALRGGTWNLVTRAPRPAGPGQTGSIIAQGVRSDQRRRPSGPCHPLRSLAVAQRSRGTPTARMRPSWDQSPTHSSADCRSAGTRLNA